VKSLMVREKKIPERESTVTPVGIILVLIGLGASFQLATRGPALLAAGLAVLVAAGLRTLSQRASTRLRNMASTPRSDPWARPSRDERRAMARSLKLSMSLTSLSSMFPVQTERGYALADRMGLA